ncbi:hypothetical protein FQZ97_1168810 [compost metagenome]
MNRLSSVLIRASIRPAAMASATALRASVAASATRPMARSWVSSRAATVLLVSMKLWMRVWLDFSALTVSEPRPKPTRSVAFFWVLTFFWAISARD